MGTGLLTPRSPEPETETPDTLGPGPSPSSGGQVEGVPRYSQGELPTSRYSDISRDLSAEQQTVSQGMESGQADQIPQQAPETSASESTEQSPDESTEQNPENGEQTPNNESQPEEESGEPTGDEAAPNGEQGSEENAEEESEEDEEEDQEQDEEEEGEASIEVGPAGGGRADAGGGESSPIMPLVAAIPRMARIQTPYIPSPPLEAIQRREEIIQRTGSPPELHHAQVRKAAEDVTQAARDAQRQMIIRVGYIARDTRISIEDMADEVWKAARSAIGSINGAIDGAITRIEQSAGDEIQHVKDAHVVQEGNVQETRDNTVLEIYGQLKENSTAIREAEAIADQRFEAKVPTAEGFIRAVPDQGRVGRLASKNAEGEFGTDAAADVNGTMVEQATEDPQADYHIVDEAKSFVDGFLVNKAERLSGSYANLKRYYLARTRPYLEGYANSQQNALDMAAQQSAERLIHPANKAQFMTMVLGLTIPVSEHHDEDQTASMDTETHRNDEELAALNRADAQAVFTLRQKRDMATEYANLDLRQSLTDNLRKQGRNARDSLRLQAKQAEIGLNSSTEPMAEDYVDLIRRLDAMMEPGKLLNAAELVPRILAARESLVNMLASHEKAAEAQAEGTRASMEKIKRKQLDAISKSLNSAIKSIDQIVVRAAFDMSMFSSMMTGSMSDGARAGMESARAYAEEMTKGILSTNERVRGPAMDQIDNIAASFCNSSIGGTEQAQFRSLSNFVDRMEGRGTDSQEGGPLSRVMNDNRDSLQTKADTLHRITRGPDPAVVAGGAVLTYAIPLVGAVATGVYLYKSDPDEDQVIEILGRLVWPGVPAVGDMFQKRGHGNLKTRIEQKLNEPARSTATGLFSESAAVRGYWRAHGMENSTGWFDLSRGARDALGEGMTEAEHSGASLFFPEKMASARQAIVEDLESHEQEIALAHLENNHERAIAAQTLEALEKGRKDSSWGWIFSAEEARNRSDRARVEAIANMDKLLREHQERHNSFVDPNALSSSRDTMFQEIASLTDPFNRDASQFTAEQGQQALINEATRSHHAAVLGFGINPLMPLAGPSLQVDIEQIDTSDQAEQYIRDAVTLGSDSDEAKASRAAFEMTQAESHSMFGFGVVQELPESTQMHLTTALENRTLSGLQQQLDDLDRQLAATQDPDEREDLMARRRGVQSQFDEEQGKHRQQLLRIMQRLDPEAAEDMTPEQAEQEMSRRVGDLFARRDGMLTPDAYSHRTYGEQMITGGRASLEAGAALASEGWGTHEQLLIHSYTGRSQAELDSAREWWSDNYHEDMDVAMGIKDREWEASDYLMFGLSPALWFANRGAETSGDTAMQLERLANVGEPKSDIDFMRNANLRHNQDRVRGTGLIASVTMEGTNAQRNLDGDREQMARLIIEEAERRSPGSAAQFLENPTAVFRADGSLDPSIQALTFRDGNFLGDRTLFAASARSVHNSAQAYQAEIALQESIFTTTIAIVALVATVAAMLIPGVNAVAAGVAVAIISGMATMAVKAGMRGERYGWEEAATDVAMTAIEAGSAGLGGALGKVGAFARLGKVGGAVAREAISGALTAGAQVAIQDGTWSDGFGKGLENIANGAIKQAAIQGVSAGVSEAITGRLNKAFAGNLDAGEISRAQRAASSMGPHKTAAVTEAVAEFFGSAAGESVGLAIDHARGNFKGNFGDALKHIGLNAVRDMAIGGLRGAVNSVNKQRYQQLLQSARESGSVSEAQLKAIRLAGISAGELQYDQDISHVRMEVEGGRAALARLPVGLREQAQGLDVDSLNTLLRVIDNGDFGSVKDRDQFMLKAFESIPGFDAREFHQSLMDAAAGRQQAKTRDGPDSSVAGGIRNRLGEGLDPELRGAMDTLPVDGLQHLSPAELRQVAEMVASGKLDSATADALFRSAKAADAELDESTFLGNLHRAVETAEQARAYDRAKKQRAYEEVLDAVPEADRRILAGMPEEGILAFKQVLDAGEAGSPQDRERLFQMAREANPELQRAEFDRIVNAGVETAQQARRASREAARSERERQLSFVPEAQRQLVSELPEHALVELRIQQQQGDTLSPDALRKLIDSALKVNPDIDVEALSGALHKVVAKPAPEIAPEQLALMRQHLESGLPPEQRGLTADVPIIVMRSGEFEALTRSESGQAVTMMLHGRPVVVMREGADPAVLREEGIHILQSQDPDWADRVGMLDEAKLANWDELPLAQQIALYQNKVEVELDAQRRLMESLAGELDRSSDPAEQRRLRNRLALAEASHSNLLRRFGEVQSLSGLHLLAIASGEMARPQWLDQPARLFNKDKDPVRDDTEPIREELSREFILAYLTEGQKRGDAEALVEQIKDLPTADLNRLVDLSSSPEHMRGLLAHVQRAEQPAQHLSKVVNTLERLRPGQADAIVRQLGAFARGADFNRYMDGLIRLGELGLTDQQFTRLVELGMGSGKSSDSLDPQNFRNLLELALPKDDSTPAKLDTAELQRFIDLGGDLDAGLMRKLMQAANEVDSARTLLEHLENITRSMDPITVQDLLLFVTANRNLTDVKQVIANMHQLRNNTPADATYHDFFAMLVLTDSGKLNMLSKLADLTSRLDAQGRRAFADFIERTDQSKHAEVIEYFSNLHETVLKQIQGELLPGQEGRLLNLIIEMAATRTQWKVFRKQAVVFLEALHALRNSSKLRQVEIRVSDDETRTVDGVAAILEHLTKVKDDSSLSETDRAEALEQLAADITAATKQLYTQPTGDTPASLRGPDELRDVLIRQVKNLESGEGVLAGKDAWRAHLSNESATWERMKTSPDSEHFAALLKAVKPQWDNEGDQGQLGALKRLQPWFEKLANIHGLDPRSNDPAVQKQLQDLLQQYLGPVRDIKKRERFDELSRALREATVEASLKNRADAEQERADLRADILRKVGLTEDKLASARPQDGEVIREHINELVKRYQEYQEAVRLAENIGASTAGLKQNVTEAIGEIGLTIHMLNKQSDMLLAMPFGKGTGFDQVWIRTDTGKLDGAITEVVISEAKGPGAALGNPAKGPQMSRTWVKNTLESMAYSGDLETRKLARRLIEATNLPKGRTPPLYRGIVVRAEESDASDPDAFQMGDKFYKPVDVTTPDTGGAGYNFDGVTLPDPTKIIMT